MKYHKVVGIDLGTTYSVVSVWDHERQDVVVIPTATGSLTLPSVVGLDPEGQVMVGEPAQRTLVLDPANTVIEVKREMGTYVRKPDPATDDPGEPRRIFFRGHHYLPQEISAFILMELKRQAEHFLGEPVHDAVITVPAYFGEPQMGATADSAAMARLNLKRLLNEPTAAAVCFGADKVQDDKTHTYAVYDLGGGTFDVSIIQVSRKYIGVVGTGGNPRLGGGDFDDRITGWVMEQIRVKHGVDLSKNPAIWARIKREAEMRKRELAAATATTLDLPFLTSQLSVNIPITRAILESLIEDLLQSSLVCLDEAIESAYKANTVAREEIEQVLLVGGSTRIRRVRALLAEHMGMQEADIRADINPDLVVSRGAAMVAREYNPSESYEGKEFPIELAAPAGPGAAEAPPALVLQDVTSHSLGILVNVSDFLPLIPKESRLPATGSNNQLANGGRAKEIPVLIFQGEDPVAYNNTLIGKLPIILPEAREEGYYRFEATFSLNDDGLLSVAVKCLNDNQIWKTDLQCNVRATKQQIEDSARHLQEVMASGEAVGESRAVPASAGSLPKPRTPSGLPRPPMPPPGATPPPRPAAAQPPPVPASARPGAPAADIPAPPEAAPDQFKGTARRSFKLISQMPVSAKREELVAAYLAFVKAVLAQAPNLEDIGDELEDAYIKCKS